MRLAHLPLLICPDCAGSLAVEPPLPPGEDPRLEHGLLRCTGCGAITPVRAGVPRFVPERNYSQSFGWQWNRHARTQLDSFTGQPISRTRFFAETRWPERLEGETILEAGGGAGRFTEVAAATGATVVSVDLSSAVDANYAANGQRPNVLIVQADLRRPPLRPGSFSRLFCFGVLQHTPDVEASLKGLVRWLQPGGQLAVDVYLRAPGWRQALVPKYWVRPLTRRLPAPLLYQAVSGWVRALWPALGAVQRRTGRSLGPLLLVNDYRGVYDLPEPTLLEWAILDTFDGLAPAYDQPQTVETVRRWLHEAGLEQVEAHPGHNGIEGRGRRPAATPAAPTP